MLSKIATNNIAIDSSSPIGRWEADWNLSHEVEQTTEAAKEKPLGRFEAIGKRAKRALSISPREPEMR